MNHRKHFFINRLWKIFLFLDVILWGLAITCLLKENRVSVLGIGFLIFALFGIAGLILCPICFVIDRNGIRIYYAFIWKEDISWENAFVTLKYDTGTRSLPYLFDTFKIYGTSNHKKQYFFMRSEISRSRRARKWIEHYTGEKIEGFLIDEIKEDISEWQEKQSNKQANRLQKDLQAVKAAERQARALLRRVLSALPIENNAYDVSYFYRTPSADCNVRPAESYNYTARIAPTEQASCTRPLEITLVEVKKKKRRIAYTSATESTLQNELEAYKNLL